MKRDLRITALLRWYNIHRRDLPWRHTQDPYHILISEIMLQQTQASRVIDFFDRWIKRFPTWKSLADASTPDLLHAWAGLGYNRRALYLREAAKHVVEHGVPETEEEWRLLKGVGPYTAAAVYAFSAQKPAAAIDTNIRRVIGRLILGIPTPSLKEDTRILAYLRKALSQKQDWRALHALMDIGATICTPRHPLCDQCPFRKACKGRARVSRLDRKNTNTHKAHETIQEGKKFPDRIYRGRILKLIREHERMKIPRIGMHIDDTFEFKRDQPWLLRMIDRMKKDGFVLEEKNYLILAR